MTVPVASASVGADGWHRTVLCHLVPMPCPLGRAGLARRRRCPLASRRPGSLAAEDSMVRPGRQLSHPHPLVGQGHTWPPPGTKPKAASADHHRRSMMPRHRDRMLRRLVKGSLPVALAPFRGPAGIHRDDPQACVGGHPHQQLPELPGGHPRDRPAEALGAPAAAEGLPAGLPRVGEVQVLHHHRPAAVGPGQPDHGRHRRAQPAVPGRCRQPAERQRDGVRWAQRVPGGVEDPAVQVLGVEVDPERPVPVPAQPLQRWHRHGRQPPAGIQVPALPGRVQQQVVADRAAGCLRGPLTSPMVEHDRAGQPVGGRPAGRVGQVRQRGRQPQLQPALLGVDADGLVAPPLAGLPVGGQKPPRGLPALPPPGLRQPAAGVVTVDGVAQPGQPPATPAHRHPTRRQPRLHLGQPGLQLLQPALLLEPLRARPVAPHPALPLPDRHPKTGLEPPDRAAQPHPGVQQVVGGPLPLVARGAGDRPRPAAGRGRRDRPLAVGPLVVATAEPATNGQVAAGQPAKVLADRAHHRLVPGRQPQPGADAGADGRGDHERGGKRTHVPIVTDDSDSQRERR